MVTQRAKSQNDDRLDRLLDEKLAARAAEIDQRLAVHAAVRAAEINRELDVRAADVDQKLDRAALRAAEIERNLNVRAAEMAARDEVDRHVLKMINESIGA